MPWFDPIVERPQFIQWAFPLSQPHKVAKWPHPDSNRTNSRFRLPYTKDLLPTASRWEMNLQGIETSPPDPVPELNRTAWVDLVYLFGSILEGVVLDDGSGFEMFMLVETFESLPTLGVSGVEIQAGVQHPTFGSYGQIEEWPAYGTQRAFPSFQNFAPVAPETVRFMSAEWPWPLTFISLAAVSDCFEFDSFLLP